MTAPHDQQQRYAENTVGSNPTNVVCKCYIVLLCLGNHTMRIRLLFARSATTSWDPRPGAGGGTPRSAESLTSSATLGMSASDSSSLTTQRIFSQPSRTSFG